MSDSVTVAPLCPRCKADDSIDMSGGTRLCLQCQNEWDPRTEVAESVLPNDDVANVGVTLADWQERILSAPTVDAVLAPGNGDVTTNVGPLRSDPAFTDATDWSDKFVRLPDGRTGLVVTDNGKTHVSVQFSDGTRKRVARASCMYLGDEPLSEGTGVVGVADDEPLPQTMLAVAGLALTIGVEAFGDGGNGDWGINSPRIGWLPPPCDQIPEVECGIAYAIAALIGVFGLDTEQVTRLAANLIQGAEVGTETGEAT